MPNAFFTCLLQGDNCGCNFRGGYIRVLKDYIHTLEADAKENGTRYKTVVAGNMPVTGCRGGWGKRSAREGAVSRSKVGSHMLGQSVAAETKQRVLLQKQRVRLHNRRLRLQQGR